MERGVGFPSQGEITGLEFKAKYFEAGQNGEYSDYRFVLNVTGMRNI